MIERGDSLIGGACALAQLRHQNAPPIDLMGIKLPAQPLDSDLPSHSFPCVPPKAAMLGPAAGRSH
jgi:hypothetical protein